MADDTDQANQSDQQLLHRQFTTVFEQLIHIAQFSLPFVLVLLDDMNDVLGSKVVETSDNPNAVEAINFVASEGIEDGLSYPLHMMVRDTNGCVAYVYLDDIDAQPDMKIVHVDESE
jgi:hypothetical protein